MLADISHFTSPYDHLNDPDKAIPITRLKLARCVMMAGCNGARSFYEKGIFRLINLFSLVYANITHDGAHLNLDPSFYKLDQSEKNPVSYHLGTGLTKAFAEDYLNVPWLSHVSSYKSLISWAPALATTKVSLYAPPKNKKAREPDLIGYDANREVHILESKGYSSGFDKAILQHAINQVSQVIEVSGSRPMTRVACFHDFSESPFRARIVDPMNDGNGGCNIDWKFEDCIRAYYAVFLTNKNTLREQNFGGRTYKVFDILKSGTVFGVDKEILDAIDANIENFISIHKKIIGERSNNIQGSNNNSAYDLGKDCVILLDEHRSSFPALSDEKLPLIHLRKRSRN